MIILVIAAVVSLLLGEWVDSIAIMVIVVLNAVVGVVQESKAEQALAALKKMAAPNAQVIRDGHQVTVPSREIVGGDIVLLEAGNYVPADVRLFESFNLKVEEASLTGESVPVEKDPAVVLDKEIPLGDRRNTAFMGTLITYGRGKGLVTCTGMNTQIGLIAQMIQSFEDEATPLQKKLEQLGKVLGTACLAICAIVFVYGLFRDTHITDVRRTSACSSYLETETQGHHQPLHDGGEPRHRRGARGAAGHRDHLPGPRHAADDQAPRAHPEAARRRDARLRHGDLLRQDRHPHAEPDDGRAGVGRRPALPHHRRGLQPDGRVLPRRGALRPARRTRMPRRCCRAPSPATTRSWRSAPTSRARRSWHIIGDPTEGAMVVAAAKGGYLQDEFAKALPRVQEIPFDSERKRMTTIHRNDGAGAVAASGFANTRRWSPS